jgi:hypothetical protein
MGTRAGKQITLIQVKRPMQPRIIMSISKISLCAILALGFLSQAQAEDKKADPSGTWTWTAPSRGGGGGERKMSLKLKTEGDKVTGTLTSPGRDGQTRDTEITDGKLKGDEISFTVTREFNGNKMTTKYNGKVSADSIKGKAEFERDGQTQSRDWEAKRETEKK